MGIFDRPSLDPLPEPDFEDVKYASGKTLVSLVPGLGEAWGLVMAAPVEQRRDDWLRDLESRLRELEQRVTGFRFDDLGQNQAFVSATLQATQAALRTHEKEKLEALRNAVVNIAAGAAPGADKQAFFLQFVDRFSPLHLRLLKFFDDPKRLGATWVNHERGSTSVYEVIYTVFPDLCGQYQLVSAVVVDLSTAGLIAATIQHAMSQAPPYPKWATFLGEEFLRFIQSPHSSAADEEAGQ